MANLVSVQRAVRSALRVSPRLYAALSTAKFRAERTARRVKLWFSPKREAHSSATPRAVDDKDTLIIEIGYGGLGDSLLHSHLPRIAKETGKYRAVFLSNLIPFRRAVHRRFVWEMNPYVDGFTDRPGLSFQELLIKKGISPTRFSIREGMNILDEIMLAYGLDDGLRCHEPEMYYKPRPLLDYSNKILYDPNWVSPLNDTVGAARLEEYFRANEIRVDMQFAPRGNSNPLKSCTRLIHDQSFEEFCDILHSCGDIYCFATGTAALAAALGKRAHVFYHSGIKADFLFSTRHEYISLDAREDAGAT
ncbi:MAG: hypothetical protein EPO20_09735 [Betaproteobacteria bacterium]|nr:MAG: hypothetical protein EPO20_09735 [Betaproteobacteria bacterium]